MISSYCPYCFSCMWINCCTRKNVSPILCRNYLSKDSCLLRLNVLLPVRVMAQRHAK